MKSKLLSIVILISLVLALVGQSSVFAQANTPIASDVVGSPSLSRYVQTFGIVDEVDPFGGHISGESIVVQNTNDSGAGSLRQAIADAGVGDVITFAPSLSGQMIVLASTLGVSKRLTIDGSGLISQIQISGNNLRSVLSISAGSVVLKNLHIRDGYAAFSPGGGGIRYQIASPLSVIDCTFSNNHAANTSGLANGEIGRAHV